MNENEYLTVNDRYYVNPRLSVDESEQFLETLRNAQKQGNAQIAQETHALGTDVPSSMGGLSGSGGIWEQRYQNPKVDSAIAKLRDSMQADALSKTMNNIVSQKQQEYKDAYRAAYKKQLSNSGGGGNNGGGEEEKLDITTNGNNTNLDLEIIDNPNTGEGQLVPIAPGFSSYTSNGENYTLEEPTSFERTIIKSDPLRFNNRQLQDGQTVTVQGTTYRYVKNNQYPQGTWFVQDRSGSNIDNIDSRASTGGGR